MASRLTVEERTKIAARHEVWNSVVLVQRWRRAWKGKHGPETIKSCHTKLMTMGSVNNARRSGHPTTSQSVENMATVQEMFNCSPQNSAHQAAHESGLTRHIICMVLHKELNFYPWKPHCVQELKPEDCESRTPRRPDLILCDFYLWGFTKEEVYKTKPCPPSDLETWIQEVLNNIPDDVLQKVVHFIPSCLRKLVEATGAYDKI
eukprot:XP_014768905.1 PREDICTED: uncharacterized protein LOC106868252 [Octopus bimaculoides]